MLVINLITTVNVLADLGFTIVVNVALRGAAPFMLLSTCPKGRNFWPCCDENAAYCIFFFLVLFFPTLRDYRENAVIKNNSADDPALLHVICIFSANFIFCVVLAFTFVSKRPLKKRSCGVDPICYPHCGVK